MEIIFYNNPFWPFLEQIGFHCPGISHGDTTESDAISDILTKSLFSNNSRLEYIDIMEVGIIIRQ